MSIEWCKKDIRSYTKLIPSLEKFPNDVIAVCDDDVFYLKDWLKNLYNAYLKYDCIVASRGYDFNNIISDFCHNIKNISYHDSYYVQEGADNIYKNVLYICVRGVICRSDFFL